MVILRIGLYVSVGLAILATVLSHQAGYPIEVAMLRGLVAFMAASFVAYMGELVVMTAPPPPREESEDDEYEYDDTDDDESMEPVSLPAIRSERDAAVDDSQAA